MDVQNRAQQKHNQQRADELDPPTVPARLGME